MITGDGVVGASTLTHSNQAMARFDPAAATRSAGTIGPALKIKAADVPRNNIRPSNLPVVSMSAVISAADLVGAAAARDLAGGPFSDAVGPAGPRSAPRRAFVRA